ncbi:unnamed protein product, partial [Scytosiphon promiscuus]
AARNAKPADSARPSGVTATGRRTPVPAPSAAAAAAGRGWSERSAPASGAWEKLEGAGQDDPESLSAGVAAQKSKKKKKKKKKKRDPAASPSAPPSAHPPGFSSVADVTGGVTAAATTAAAAVPTATQRKTTREGAGGTSLAEAPIVVPLARGAQGAAPTRAELLTIAAAEAKEKAKKLQQATAKAQREAERALREMSEEMRRIEEGGSGGAERDPGSRRMEPQQQEGGSTDSPRGRYDVSSSEDGGAQGSGSPERIAGATRLLPEPLDLPQQQSPQRPRSGEVGEEGPPRARYDVSSSEEGGDLGGGTLAAAAAAAAAAGVTGGSGGEDGGISPARPRSMDEEEYEEQDGEDAPSPPGRYDVSSSERSSLDGGGSGSGSNSSRSTVLADAAAAAATGEGEADEGSRWHLGDAANASGTEQEEQSPAIGRYDVSSEEEEEEEEDGTSSTSGNSDGDFGGRDGGGSAYVPHGFRSSSPAPSPAGSMPRARYDVSSSDHDSYDGDDDGVEEDYLYVGAGRRGRDVTGGPLSDVSNALPARGEIGAGGDRALLQAAAAAAVPLEGLVSRYDVSSSSGSESDALSARRSCCSFSDSR